MYYTHPIYDLAQLYPTSKTNFKKTYRKYILISQEDPLPHVLPHHPMHFIFFILTCDTCGMCLMYHVTSYFLLCPLLYGVALSDSVILEWSAITSDSLSKTSQYWSTQTLKIFAGVNDVINKSYLKWRCTNWKLMISLNKISASNYTLKDVKDWIYGF